LVDFLKRIFLHESIIYDKITNEQLLKIIISFVTKEKDSFFILEYLMSYFIYEHEYNLLLDKITLQTKNEFIILRKEISFSKIKNAFSEKKESFLFVKGMIDELQGILKHTDNLIILENIFSFLETIAFFIVEMKSEFLVQLNKKIVKILSDTFEIILQETKKPFLWNDQMKKSAEYSWPVLSKILLFYNRKTENPKKKKEVEKIDKSIINLVATVRKCEEALLKEGFDIKIKKWGFQMIDNKNTV
jgi:hypothetical protein